MTEPKVRLCPGHSADWSFTSQAPHFPCTICDLRARVEELEEKSRIDDEQGDLMAEECARLAARAQELEDGYGKCVVNRAELQIENTRLRKALEGQADLYRELAARVDDDENSLVAENTRLREREFFIVSVYDRHTDPQHELFSDKEVAIQRAKGLAEELSKHGTPGQCTVQELPLRVGEKVLVYHATYCIEGDRVEVTRAALKEKPNA